MSLSDKIIFGGREISISTKGEDHAVIIRRDLKESISRILDKRRKYTPTKEWVVLVEDIMIEFGNKLIDADAHKGVKG